MILQQGQGKVVMSSRGPSKHLSWKELACKDGTPYPEEWRGGRAKVLATLFEEIRYECNDKPIKVTSAFRTRDWNELIGGARKSQHKLGRALDLIPPRGMSVGEFYRIIKRVHDKGGIGKYKGFVHVDIRDADRLVAWTGKGVKDLLT